MLQLGEDLPQDIVGGHPAHQGVDIGKAVEPQADHLPPGLLLVQPVQVLQHRLILHQPCHRVNAGLHFHVGHHAGEKQRFPFVRAPLHHPPAVDPDGPP